MDDAVAHWRSLVTGLLDGRDVILAGGVLAGFAPRINRMREYGMRRILLVANGNGTGPLPTGDDVETVIVPFEAEDMTGEFRNWERALADPAQHLLDAIQAFDPH